MALLYPFRKDKAKLAQKIDALIEQKRLKLSATDLAEVYALMVWHHDLHIDEDGLPGAARDAWLAWYATMPDAPCIAICSTSQGDDVCKGCGRSFDEVQNWTVMTPGEKRATWRRITMDGTAWRFNRYAERANEPRGEASAGAGS